MSSDKKEYNKIPDSSSKTARGSKKVHSEKDNSRKMALTQKLLKKKSS
tara:strand:+ start:45399 stop:45542 length:144 start_codon:yes stop_codon:yes gene_type:complete